MKEELELLNEIEVLRSELHRLLEAEDASQQLGSAKIWALSTRLDLLITRYMRMKEARATGS